MKKSMIKILVLSVFAFVFLFKTTNTFAKDTSITGCWKTIDDKSKQVKSKVCLWKNKKNGKIYGAIKKLYNRKKGEEDPICTKCKGWRKGKRTVGLVIVTNMKKDGDEYSGGHILDPANGKTYRCKMWREGSKLKVRGYIAFFYRTQTWVK